MRGKKLLVSTLLWAFISFVGCFASQASVCCLEGNSTGMGVPKASGGYVESACCCKPSSATAPVSQKYSAQFPTLLNVPKSSSSISLLTWVNPSEVGLSLKNAYVKDDSNRYLELNILLN
jgi:hypothetical protein